MTDDVRDQVRAVGARRRRVRRRRVPLFAERLAERRRERRARRPAPTRARRGGRRAFASAPVLETRTLAVDLDRRRRSQTIVDATADLEVGLLVYCAGGDPNLPTVPCQPDIGSGGHAAAQLPGADAAVPPLRRPMVERGRGGIVIFTREPLSPAAGTWSPTAAPRRSTWCSPKACGCELHDKGVDVLGLILGKTDTPALRQLEFERGRLASLDEVPEGAVTAASVVDEAFANLGNGPTIATGDDVRMGLELFKSLSRNEVVRLIMQVSSRSHGYRRAPGELDTTMFTLRFDMRAPAIGGPPTDLYAAASEMSAWAETRGCVAAVLCEHHCADDGYLPSPLLLGAAIAARTEQLMLNLVILLPLYDVARLAEDISVLDHISAGRATYVFGIGYRAEEFDHFGLSMSDRGRIADEKLGLLRRLLAGEEVEHGGRRMKVTPRPRRRKVPC